MQQLVYVLLLLEICMVLNCESVHGAPYRGDVCGHKYRECMAKNPKLNLTPEYCKEVIKRRYYCLNRSINGPEDQKETPDANTTENGEMTATNPPDDEENPPEGSSSLSEKLPVVILTTLSQLQNLKSTPAL